MGGSQSQPHSMQPALHCLSALTCSGFGLCGWVLLDGYFETLGPCEAAAFQEEFTHTDKQRQLSS